MNPHWSTVTAAMLCRKMVAMAKQADRLTADEPLENAIPELSKG
jgi:hypothetical protein